MRLRDERDMYKGLMNTQEDPILKYQETKKANRAYFKDDRRSTSLEERIKTSFRHTAPKNHPETHLRGAFKALD